MAAAHVEGPASGQSPPGRPLGAAAAEVQDPLSTLRDVDELTYVSRGASSVVFQGVWQGSEVAVKFLISDMSIHSASAREALLCKELAHPHIVQCYAARCVPISASFLVHSVGSMSAEDAEQMSKTALALAGLGRAWAWGSWDSRDGFGEPLQAASMLGMAFPALITPLHSLHTTHSHSHSHSQSSHASMPRALSRARSAASGATSHLASSPATAPHSPMQHSSPASSTAAPLPGANTPSHAGYSPAASCSTRSLATNSIPEQSSTPSVAGLRGAEQPHNPWGPHLSWGLVLQALSAEPGQLLTVIIAEYGNLGPLSAAIHNTSVFRLGTGAGGGHSSGVGASAANVALRAILRTTRDITLGLHYLHSRNIIHSDLKPANVVLCSSRADRRGYTAKLTDLGFARVIPSRPSLYRLVDTSALPSDVVTEEVDWGTTPYMAPEHFAGRICPASDIYSLGVTLWEMCHQERPFAPYTQGELAQGIPLGRIKLTWRVAVPAPLVRLATRCMSHNPARRPSTSYVLSQLAEIEAGLRAASHEEELEEVARAAQLSQLSTERRRQQSGQQGVEQLQILDVHLSNTAAVSGVGMGSASAWSSAPPHPHSLAHSHVLSHAASGAPQGSQGESAGGGTSSGGALV